MDFIGGITVFCSVITPVWGKNIFSDIKMLKQNSHKSDKFAFR